MIIKKNPQDYLRVIKIQKPTFDKKPQKIFIDLSCKIMNSFHYKVLVMSEFGAEILYHYLQELLKGGNKN